MAVNATEVPESTVCPSIGAVKDTTGGGFVSTLAPPVTMSE